MSDVFISYASQDRATAEKLANVLAGEGWSVWWDRTIPPGKTFARMIEDALTAAKCVVVLWSQISRESDWVQNEARFGHKRQVLIPALIEDVEPPFEFGHIHAASLIDWQGDTSHLGYRQLVAAISDIAGPPPKLVEEQKRKAAEEEARKQAEAEAKRKAEEEETARQKAALEEEAKRKAEGEEALRRKAEAEAKRRAEEEERRKAEEQEARRQAEKEAASKEAETEAKRKEEEETARKKAQTDAKRQAEESVQTAKASTQEAARGITVEAKPGSAGKKWALVAAVLVLVAGGIGVALYQRSVEQDRVLAEQVAERKAEEEARRKAEEQEAARKRAEEEEARRKAAEEAARREAEPVVEALAKEMVALTNTNVREGPGVEFDKVSTFSRGSSVQVTGHTDDWYRVALADGAEAYVFKELLGERAAPDTLQPGKTFRDCDACPEMIVVPAGSFLMGSPSSDMDASDNEKPQHRVTIAKPFAVGVYEVTFAEWDACVDAGGCNGHRPEDRGWGRDRRPVINVSWKDARAYTDWLVKETGEDYRLLTEAEWEYVARAGTTTRYWFGDSITEKDANFGQIVGKTTEVGKYPANAWGVSDMHGNVWEWVADCYEKDAYKTHAAYPAMVGSWQASCVRVLRGGSWVDDPWNLRSAIRDRDVPDNRFYYDGFRVARTI